MDIAGLRKAVKLMKHHFRVFEEAEEFLAEIESIKGQIKELDKTKECLIQDIKRFGKSKRKAEGAAIRAEDASAAKIQHVESLATEATSKLTNDFNELKARVEIDKKAIEATLVAAQEQHDRKMASMKTAEAEQRQKVDAANAALDALKKQIDTF